MTAQAALDDFVSSYPRVASAYYYADQVLSDQIIACKKVKLACQRFLDDLHKAEAPEFRFRFDLDVAEAYCDKFERYPHSKGRWAREQVLLELEPWQAFIVVNLFGWLRKDNGKRRFLEIYLQVARKNGKSFFAAVLGLVMGFEDEEFGAEVYCGATSERQAYEVFTPALRIAPKVDDLEGVQVFKKSIVRINDNSKFEPVVGKPGDGSSPHCAIVDEFHEHPTWDQYETMSTGMGGREQPLMAVTTTSGWNIGGPCHEHYMDISRQLEEGHLDDTIFALIYEAEEDDDWTSDEALKKANPNLDVSVSYDFLDRQRSQAMRTITKQNFFRTKHLNQWVGAQSAWLNVLDWKNCGQEGLKLEDYRGCDAYIGVDLSSFLDLSAIGVVIVSEWPKVPIFTIPFAPQAAVRENRKFLEFAQAGDLIVTPGEKTDYAFIEEQIARLGKIVTIKGVAYDQWQAEYLATRLESMGLKIYRFAHNYNNFNETMKHFEGAVAAGDIVHGDQPSLNWASGNVHVKTSPHGDIMPMKSDPNSGQKIDPMVAVLMGYAQILKRNLVQVESIYDSDEYDTD